MSRFAVTALLITMLAAGGCVPTRLGPTGGALEPEQTAPHQPLGAGGLIPSRKDKDAGLVDVAPGVDIRRYTVVAVDLCAVAESEIKDEKDREYARTLPAFFQAETVRRLRATGLFVRVVSLGEAPPLASSDRALRIECIMTRLAPGAVEARLFLGAGAGRTKAQIELRFVDVQTDTIMMVTADRRVDQGGPIWRPVDSESLLRESFHDMARDLAKFLVRLSKGEAPKAE